MPRALLHGVAPFVRAEADNPRELFAQLRAAMDGQLGDTNTRIENLETALNAVVGGALPGGISAAAILNGGGRSWGDQVVNAPELTEFRNAAGKARVQINLKPNAAITSVTPGGGPLITPDRAEGVQLARRRLTVRALLGTGTTGSNMVEYPRQTTRDNQAATVDEGALKPESNLAWELKQAKVATIAHWVPASRQVLDDAPQLRTLIDG
jgi:HK97 family phage major capsid protein